MKSKMGDDAEIYIGMDIAFRIRDPAVSHQQLLQSHVLS